MTLSRPNDENENVVLASGVQLHEEAAYLEALRKASECLTTAAPNLSSIVWKSLLMAPLTVDSRSPGTGVS